MIDEKRVDRDRMEMKVDSEMWIMWNWVVCESVSSVGVWESVWGVKCNGMGLGYDNKDDEDECKVKKGWESIEWKMKWGVWKRVDRDRMEIEGVW